MSDGTVRGPARILRFASALRVVVLAVLAALAIRTLLFEPFSVPSESMEPALLPGDYLFVNKFAYGYARPSLPWGDRPGGERIAGRIPSRGDIVVFVDPAGSGSYFVKRVAGLPGETVALRSGTLLIDSRPTRIARTPEPMVRKASYPETVVPAGHLFLLGDNRNASLDSRYGPAEGGFGMVPVGALVGEAGVIFFSLDTEDANGWFSRLRLSRIGSQP